MAFVHPRITPAQPAQVHPARMTRVTGDGPARVPPAVPPLPVKNRNRFRPPPHLAHLRIPPITTAAPLLRGEVPAVSPAVRRADLGRIPARIPVADSPTRSLLLPLSRFIARAPEEILRHSR